MRWDITIISGGQTGADRAALDFAIEHGIPHAGWCPKGRKALDGPLSGKYQLKETPLEAYAQRTEWNVVDSDGTVIFTLGKSPSAGALKTIQLAQTHGRPWIHLHRCVSDAPEKLLHFVDAHKISRLNVAGSRESTEPGVYAWVTSILESSRTLRAFRANS